MLQSAKNLVKFVQTINPNKEATIRLGIGYDLEIDGFFYYHIGNGKEVFSKLMMKGLFNLEADENYYKLDGTLDGYRVNVRFEIKQKNDIVELERHDPKAGYPELAKCSTYWNYMTPEEWEKFIFNLDEQNYNRAKKYMELHQNDDEFRSYIGAGFAWDSTKEGADYWIEISKRTAPIV